MKVDKSIRVCKYCKFYMTCPMCSGPNGKCKNWADRLEVDDEYKYDNKMLKIH